MDDRDRRPAAEGDAPTPRWVYVAGIVVIGLALALVAMHLGSGGVPAH
jgi:hypothetical protein